MDRETWVYMEIGGDNILVGRFWSHVRRGRESASFQYDETWLQYRERFALEPALMLSTATHHTHAGKALFGAYRMSSAFEHDDLQQALAL